MKRDVLNFFRSNFLIWALLFAAPALVYHDVLFGDRTLSFNPRSAIPSIDSASTIAVSDPAAGSWQDEPWLFFIRDSLLHHRLPIANLRNALGEPFIESLQSGVFYPLNILLPLLPAHSSQFFDIFQIAHLYILLFGFLILARLYLPLPAAALLALSTALSGGAFLNINMIHFRAFAWLPLMMAGAVEMARSTERRGALLLSMGIVCSITAGNPQESVMHLIAAGVCYFVEQHRRIDRVSKFRYIKFLSVCICSLLIAAPAVWPFIAAQKAGELFQLEMPLVR